VGQVFIIELLGDKVRKGGLGLGLNCNCSNPTWLESALDFYLG